MPSPKCVWMHSIPISSLFLCFKFYFASVQYLTIPPHYCDCTIHVPEHISQIFFDLTTCFFYSNQATQRKRHTTTPPTPHSLWRPSSEGSAAAVYQNGHTPSNGHGIGHRAWASATPCRRLRSVLPGRSLRASGGRTPPRIPPQKGRRRGGDGGHTTR